MSELEQIALERAPECPQEWIGTLNHLSGGGVAISRIRMLVSASSSPEAFQRLGVLALNASEGGVGGADDRIQELFQAVDESDFDLAEWLDALDAMCIWLEGRGLACSLIKVGGYLHCCAMGASSGRPYASLRQIAEDYLDEFGFEG